MDKIEVIGEARAYMQSIALSRIAELRTRIHEQESLIAKDPAGAVANYGKSIGNTPCPSSVVERIHEKRENWAAQIAGMEKSIAEIQAEREKVSNFLNGYFRIQHSFRCADIMRRLYIDGITRQGTARLTKCSTQTVSNDEREGLLSVASCLLDLKADLDDDSEYYDSQGFYHKPSKRRMKFLD